MAANRELVKLARGLGDGVLRPFGETDVLLYYAACAGALEKFLAGKTLATKNWMPAGIPSLLKRGSKQPPLYAPDLVEWVDEDFLKKRVGKHLAEARGELRGKQPAIWDYFLPRKLSEFFYATNGEGEGKPVERIFIDLDRGKGVSSAQACSVAKKLVEEIADDGEFQSVAKKFFKSCRPFVSWTGSSFHFFFFLKKPVAAGFYNQHFQHDKKFPEKNFVGKWALYLQKQFKELKVVAGHEKRPGAVSLDASQTPSGKLCRAPLGSLHVANPREFDGVSLPVGLGKLVSLEEKELVGELRSYSPARVVREINSLQRLLPVL